MHGLPLRIKNNFSGGKEVNVRKIFMIAALLVVAIAAVACAPAPTPTAVPTPVPPTAAPKPTVAPAAFDLKAAFDKYFSALPDGFGGIQPAALSDQMKATKVFLVDMREASEITTNGFIEGSVNIPTRGFMKNLDKLPAKDQPIVVVCGSGFRSGFGMAALQMLGYTNVKSMLGGFTAWKGANLPVATGAPAAPVAGKAPEVDKDLLAALDKWFAALPDGFGGIAPAATKDQLAATKVALIDLREPSELASGGKIEGSVNVPVRTLIKSLDKLPADKAAPIILYCASGHRGTFGMMALQMLGYTNVKNMSGGLNAWKAANLPTVP
jgi:rhodanese-related sulfurtransferase